MKKFLGWAIVFFNCLFLQICFAWNAVGHMVVANIAYQNLTPTAKEKIAKMTTDFAKEYPNFNTFLLMAPWPDTLHGQSIELFSRWHYVGFQFKDGVPIKSNLDTDNAMWAINLMQPVLKNTNANPFEQARFLAFFIHIVGDLHQPLHAASRVSAEHPDGDQGGNLFFIQFPEGTTIPLHALWDNGCDLFSGEPTPDNIDALSKTITSDYPPSFFSDLVNDVNPNDWADEDMKLAIGEVYHTPENQVPSTTYLNEGKKIVEQRVALAGYRLANLLNALLK